MNTLCLSAKCTKCLKKLMLPAILWLAAQQAMAQPSITAVTPSSGPVGSSVVISGTNFSSVPANNTVYFGAVKATVTAASAYSLTVNVPIGATYKPVTVTANGLTASSPKPFDVTFAVSGTLGKASFAPRVDFGGIIDMTAADFDGDGKADFAITETGFTSDLVFYKNSSSIGHDSITFVLRIQGPDGDFLAATDFDGDGKLDVAALSFMNSSFTVYKNGSSPGNFSFSKQGSAYATGSGPKAIALGDINGDGKPDVVIANSNSATVSVFINTSTGGVISFAPKVDFTTDNNPDGVAIADLNGDGKQDIVTCNYNAWTISVLQDTSTGPAVAFAATVNIATAGYPFAVKIADIDGDGKPDIIASNYGGQSLSIFRRAGADGAAITSSYFANRIDYALNTHPHGFALADLDGDGKPDIVTANTDEGTVSVIKNNSIAGVAFNAGSLAARIDLTVHTGPGNIALCDMDGDGKTDIMTGNYYTGAMSVFRNQSYSLSATASGTQSSCLNSTAPSVTFTATGGSGPYTFVYNINGGAPQTVTTVSGNSATVLAPTLATGQFVYTLQTVTDGNLATQQLSPVSTTITVYTPIVSSIVVPPCNGTATGVITLTGSGGISPYRYQLSGGASYQASGKFTGLMQGTYIFSVKDSTGCTGKDTVTVVAPPVLTDTLYTGGICLGRNTTITAAGSGGTAPYKYSLNGSAQQGSGAFSKQPATGTYTIVVTDANGCKDTSSITITPPATALSATAAIVNVSCNGGSNGSVTITASGGFASSYQYSISGSTPQANDNFAGLASGAYTVAVKDAGGCTINIPASITQPTLLKALLKAGKLCLNSNTTLTASGTGGTAPYLYSLNGGANQSTGVFANQSVQGSYNVLLTDAKGCTATASMNIIPPATALSGSLISAVNPTCWGFGDGSVTVKGAGGYPPYQYKATGGAVYQNSGTFTGLYNGGLLIIIKDSGGCTTTISAPLIQPAQVSAIVKPTALCLDSNTTFTVTASGGTQPFQYSVNGGAKQASNIFNNLPAAGNYTFSVTDAHGCTGGMYLPVNPPASALKATLVINNEPCHGDVSGSVIVQASGGYSSSYQYKISSSPNYYPSSTFSNMAVGAYIFSVKDSGGCVVSIAGTVTQPAQLKAALTPSAICFASAGTLTGSGTGGTAPYLYSLSDANYQASAVFTTKGPGSYTLYLKDAHECQANALLTVKMPTAPIAAKSTVTNATGSGVANGQVVVTAKGGVSPYQYRQGFNPYHASNTFTGLIPAIYTYTVKDANGCEAAINATVGITTSLTNPGTFTEGEIIGQGPESIELKLVALPNPSKNGFTLVISDGNTNVPADIKVMDILGRVIYHTTGKTNNTYKFGDAFTAGVYFAEVVNGNERKTIKLIKASY